jgi:SAM-dependent methyltransferase/uncharacterized protein YbaR (Trm112 family)
MDRWLLQLLRCPRDYSPIRAESGRLVCDHGHRYPVIHGVPVFLLAEEAQTIEIATASLRATETVIGDPLCIDTLGLSEAEKRGIERDWSKRTKIDPVISYLVGATSGLGYVDLIGNLESYPIPEIPIDNGNGQLLLDIGSNWGRWSVSAARKGWRVIGIDPSLGAILAARRAFSQMSLNISWVCGDARFLPFKDASFGCVFSYSVIQHFSEKNAESALSEIHRVLCRGGFAKIQMANKGGLRSMYWRGRRRGHDTDNFRVRYWSLRSLRDVFERKIGPTTLVAEAFGGLGLLTEDRDYVSITTRVLISISLLLKEISKVVHRLIHFADSVYVVSIKK